MENWFQSFEILVILTQVQKADWPFGGASLMLCFYPKSEQTDDRLEPWPYQKDEFPHPDEV